MKITKKQIETLRKMNNAAVKMSNALYALCYLTQNFPNRDRAHSYYEEWDSIDRTNVMKLIYPK